MIGYTATFLPLAFLPHSIQWIWGPFSQISWKRFYK